MIMMRTAEKLKEVSERLKVPMIYKSSFTKDNRSSVEFYQGPGLDEGLKMLQKHEGRSSASPLLTDIHYPSQAKPAAEVVDVHPDPRLLCACRPLWSPRPRRTGAVVNIKHGQFLAPENMIKPAQKCESVGNGRIILTERGYTFGYNDLVVDPRAFHHMRQTGYPLVFDITHSIRKYGIPSADPRGGNREVMPTIARAGVAAGVDGVFIETHPYPSKALCDAASQLCVTDLEEFLKPLLDLHAVEVRYRNSPKNI
jgi:2-dehydro-3-deoxyphosphooctonate aldolase (KDO 8-P synthase)